MAYADTIMNGPSTEADTSRTKEFLRVRIVRLLHFGVTSVRLRGLTLGKPWL